MTRESPQSSLIGRGSVVKPRPRSSNSKKQQKSCHPLVNSTIKKRYPIFYSVDSSIVHTTTAVQLAQIQIDISLATIRYRGACCNNNCTSRFLDTKEFDGSFHVLCVRHVIATWIRTSSTTFNSTIYFCHLFGFLPAQVAEFLSVSPSPFDATQIVDITHITFFRLLQHAHTHTRTHIAHLKRSLENAVRVATTAPADVIYRKDARRRPINSL
jgi:hypothetical protein